MGYNDSMYVTGNQGLDQRTMILRAMSGGGSSYADNMGLVDFSNQNYSSGASSPFSGISPALLMALMQAQGGDTSAPSKPASDTVDKSKLIVDYSVSRDDDDDKPAIVIGEKDSEEVDSSDESDTEHVVITLGDDEKDSEESSSESLNKPSNPYTAAIGTGINGGIVAKHTKSSLLAEAARKNKLVDDLRDNHIKVQTDAEKRAIEAAEEAKAKAGIYNKNQSIKDAAVGAEAKASSLSAENEPIRARATAIENVTDAEKALAKAKKGQSIWRKIPFVPSSKEVKAAEKALKTAKETFETANSTVVSDALGKSSTITSAAEAHVTELTKLRDEIAKTSDPKKITQLIDEAKKAANGNTSLINDLDELAKHKGDISLTRTALRETIDKAGLASKTLGAASKEAGTAVAAKGVAANAGTATKFASAGTEEVLVGASGKLGKLTKIVGSTAKAGVKGNVAITVGTEAISVGTEYATTKHIKTRTAAKAGINIATSLAAGAVGAKIGLGIGAFGGPLGSAIGGIAGFVIGAGGAALASYGTGKAVDAVIDEDSRIV